MGDEKTLVNIISIVYIVLSAFGVFGGIAVMFAGPTVLGLLAAMSGDARVAAILTGLAGVAFIVGVAIVFIEGFIMYSAFQLMKFKSWARVVFIITGILSLPGFPVGTVLGGFALWVLLFNTDSVKLFAQ